MPIRPRWTATNGTERAERLPFALREGYFGVDEMGLPERVTLAAGLARHLAFHDLQDRPAGTWAAWFAGDEAFVLASLLAIDVEALRAAFLAVVDSAPEETLQLRILGLARRLDRWYIDLSLLEHPAAVALCAQIRRLAERRLAPGLAWATAGVPPAGAVAAIRVSLGSVWTSPAGQVAGRAERGRPGMRAVFFLFLDAIARLQAMARDRMAESLASDAHEPSAALFLAFLRLFETVQRRLNAFPGRHVDFYYDRCLHFGPRAAEPDHVHLLCRRVPSPEVEVIVPAGTRFALGKDDAGKPVVYRADETLAVTTVRVAELRTLRLERDPLISPERELDYVTRARVETIPGAGHEAEDVRARRYWALFGGGDAETTASSDAELGIAVASPVLFLQQGYREVRVRLTFDHPADRDAVVLERVDDLSRPVHRGTAPVTAGVVPALAAIFARCAEVDRAREPRGWPTDAAGLEAAARAAAPRLAVRVLLRRLRALDAAGATALCARVGSADAPLIVRSADPLARELRVALARTLRDRLGTGLAIRFEVMPDTPESVRLLAGGEDLLPGGHAAQRAGYDARTVYSIYLLQRLLDADDFHTRFGRLFCRWMLLDPDALDPCDIHRIKAVLRQSRHRPAAGRSDFQGPPDRADILGCLRGPRAPVRDYLFNKLFLRLFDVALTGPAGWTEVADAFVTAAESRADGRPNGLTLVARLGPEAPAVVPLDHGVHAVAWPTGHPALRLRLRHGAMAFSYSLLADVVLSTIDLAVDVRGARDMLLYNNLGRLDPSKPFAPFGPMPARGAYLVFGSAEVARKDISRLALDVTWGGLPDADGGFDAHYRGYDADLRNESFRVAGAILRDAQWTTDPAAGHQQLFTGARNEHRVPVRSRLEFAPASLRNAFRKVRVAGSGDDFQFDLSSRCGFFRFVLTDPADTFGHKAYPQLLTRVVTANARRRRPAPLPNAPWTPLVEGITFDYAASASINLAQEVPAERANAEEQVFLIHPFGYEPVYPNVRGEAAGLVPRFDHDGNLLIGIDADGPPGTVSLLFEMRDEAARRIAGEGAAPEIRWAYLAGNRWRPLPDQRVLANATHGFLTSGIVAIDLPDDIDRENTILPAGHYWIRVGADAGFDGFAGLYAVHAQALRATRVLDDAPAVTPGVPRAGTAAEPLASITGFTGAVQAGGTFGGRAPENAGQLRTRAGERLRHKNRAVSAWDYERLVLEGFPAVFKVKCFGAIAAPHTAPSPGTVTVVVVPAPPADAIEQHRAAVLNAVELENIRRHLGERTSPFVNVIVRNAQYERIRVRCAVRFKAGMPGGRTMQRLNRDLSERLSPWRSGGLGARFGWRLRKEEVESWIRGFDYVDSVARVSLLQVSEDDDGNFFLGDSARGADAVAQAALRGVAARTHGELRATFPWTIALPASQHMIEMLAEPARDEAEPVGIGRLEVGATFIVDGAGDA